MVATVTPAITTSGLEVVRLSDADGAAAALYPAWDRLVASDACSGVMQSRPWAAFKRRLGFRVEHLGLLQAGDLIGGAILYAGAARPSAGILVAPEGPVLPWHTPTLTRQGLSALLQAAERIAAEAGAVALRIEPRLTPPAPRLLRGFSRAAVDHLAVETLILDLRHDDEALLAAMHPKGRYNIRLAARRGVVVHERTAADGLADFYTLLIAAGERGGFFVEPPGFFDALMETLAPAGLARLLVADFEGEPLAAMLLITHGRRATYLYGAMSNERRELMAGYALQWAAIQAGRRAGCVEYDFYGFEPHGAPDHLYAAFSRFKKRFGGQPVRFIGAQDTFFLDRLADLVVDVARATTPQRSVYEPVWG